ncbi:MAG TPA: bifunctional phosphoribosylaminoimidazolecarboxamide formyltransferase/IMP cyclohydrolase [Kofleriaceae bacterium]|nr:bifunctional phosphoribosylaminoimidazolecarboxamide formyltransferase/IMP cyclohydrolase [Kofleriaceae bacterium]
MSKIRRAILSVSDKRGLAELAQGLARHGVEILSTGGTARALADAGVVPVAISEFTGAPEILDGRVKTLHPRIHGGLLGRDTAEHQAQMQANDIAPIDLVVVNLYPFEATVAQPGVSFEDAIENIDIGGPSMLRSAAKNHERVTVLVDPEDYAPVLAEMDGSGGTVSPETRRRLACKVFARTAAYDGAIAAFLTGVDDDGVRAELPGTLTLQYERELVLRYGENPHQSAAFYRDSGSPLPGTSVRPSLATAEVLQGKALSYNNILDLDAALAACIEFSAPTVVVVKHTNPCGVATDEAGIGAAYQAARETDPTSSFGGIVAMNRECDAALAEQLAETFLECVIAPSYSGQAREILARKKNLRLMATGPMRTATEDRAWALRSVGGGVLVQSADVGLVSAREAKVVTEREPSDEEYATLDFAWRVAKHVKSNAIVFCRGTRTVAIGAGQMSRVDSVKLAKLKAEFPLAGSAVASDAFFPFRDGVDVLAEAGATAIIQPGGSIRDQEVIAAANEHGVAMVFTGMRHFRH